MDGLRFTMKRHAMIDPEPPLHDKQEGDEEKPASDHPEGLHESDPRVPAEHKKGNEEE